MASAGSSSNGSSSSSRRTWDKTEHNQKHDTPHYGNFRGYYSMRREAVGERQDQESRLQSILGWVDSEASAGSSRRIKRVLDIGCNSGQFTLQLCEALEGRAEKVIGVDIDRELVLLAGSSARRLGKYNGRTDGEEPFVPSVLGSGRSAKGGQVGPRKRVRLEVISASTPLEARFLQSNWVYNDIKTEQRGSECPQDMTRMQWADMKEVSHEDGNKYDLILALSITKWIHINHYDTGLRRFFARIASCLEPNGIFIMEPQSYKSYKQTLKVTAPTSQPRRNFYALRVMPDDFAWILTVELGLFGPFRIRDKGKDASERQIDAFIQPPQHCIPRHCLERRAALLALAEREDPLTQIDDFIPWVPRSRQ